MRSRLYAETATTKAAAETFRASMRRSTWRSDPCATKLYGMPVRRCTTRAARAGWLAKWAWMWSTPVASIRAAKATHLGKNPRAPRKNFALPQVPDRASHQVVR
jgi:hypothetical protein